MARPTTTPSVEDEDSSYMTDTDDVLAPAAEDDPEGGLVEVSHNGRTYPLPAALADKLADHAELEDQTRRLDQARRAFNAQRTSAAGLDQTGQRLKAALHMLEGQAAAFNHVDWRGLAEQAPDVAAHLWGQYQSLRAALGEALQAHQAHHGGLSEQEAHEHAMRVEDGHGVLARELAGWSPEMAAKLAAFAQNELGFSPQELAAISDPRIVKGLHKALTGHEQAKAARLAQGQKTAPARAVRGAMGALAIAPDTVDFASFEKLADARMKRRR